MWTRRQVLARFGAVTAGVGLVAIGFFQITPAYADTHVVATMGVADINLTHKDIFAGSLNLQNLAPGDHGTGTLVVTNSANHSEWVQLDNQLNGGTPGHPNIFANYRQSIDSSAGPAFATDNHPLRFQYSIALTGANAPAQPITVSPFSSDEKSPAFELKPNQHAVVTYQYDFPLAAHNDYQSATGQMRVLVDGEDDLDGGTVAGGTNPVTGLPFGSLAAEGAGLVVLGGMLMVFARKRRSV